jgi:hypothetical protein
MNLQNFRQNLGVFAGVIVFSFTVVTTAQTYNAPQVQVRVVFADGTPLVNADIHVLVQHIEFDGSGYGSSGSTLQTDAAGYFVETLDGNDDEFYMVGVGYQGHLAKTSPFIFHEGQPQVHLLLTLNDNPVPPDRRRFNQQVFTTLETFLEPPPVWIVNPINGHAYKRIHCHDVMDAMTLAAAEGAYLVSINDKVEDVWLQQIFKPDSFWIGLSDVAEEGQWVWHSSEPVTYTNWSEDVIEVGNTDIKDYAISYSGGGWRAVGNEHPSYLTRAIFEKADIPVKTRFDEQIDAQPPGTLTPADKTVPSQTRRSVQPWHRWGWAVNPENGHAYKKIRCKNLEDAKDRAAAEGAHLVTLNDKAEEAWLLGIFGNHLYWIGLSDAEKEGEWVWQNGEPVTYTNWGAKHSFPRSTLSPEEKDSAVMTFIDGQWHAVGPGDLLWRTTRYAILEKADVFNSSPAEQK